MHVKLAEKKDIKISLLGSVHVCVQPPGDIFPSWLVLQLPHAEREKTGSVQFL